MNLNPNVIKQSFIARAKTLAHVMTRSKNIKVTVQGNQAFNVNGQINIPAGDFSDPEWLKMVTGWIDHELGHENHTNDAVFTKFAKKGKLQYHLINVVEDIWMERAVGNEFPGARQNLAVLAELAIKRNLFLNPANSEHPLGAVSAFLLYGGRAKIIGQHCLDHYADIAFSEVIKHFGDEFAKKLAAIRDDIETVHSTDGAAKIAQAVIDLLKEEKDSQQQKQQQSNNTNQADSDDNPSGDSEDDADADSDDNQSGDSDDDADDDSDDNQSGDSDDADDDSDDNQSGDSDDDEDADSDDNQSGDSEDDEDADSDDSQSGDSEDDADADSDDSQSGDSEDDADADSDDSQSGDSEDDADADSDDIQAGDSEGDADVDHSGAADEDKRNGDPHDVPSSKQQKPDLNPQQILDAIERALNEADEAELRDFHDALAELLAEDAENAKDEDADVAQCADLLTENAVKSGDNPYLDGTNLDLSLAKQVSGAVYQTMHKVLFDQVHELEVSRRVGSKLVNRKLSGIPAGNLSVFSRRSETQDVSAAITVLTDASASMRQDNGLGNGSKMGAANTCAYAFALGLDKSGVASEFIYYGAHGTQFYENYVAKTFDAKPQAERFKVTACGPSTPTGPAIKFAISSLILRKEQNKMLIVLTDGEPDSDVQVQEAVQIAKMFGIKVIPIGIMTQNVRGFEKDEFVVVHNASELAPALRNAVKMKLFN